MTCPICGKQFPAEEYQILDNGNPACPECWKNEQETEEQAISLTLPFLVGEFLSTYKMVAAVITICAICTS